MHKILSETEISDKNNPFSDDILGNREKLGDSLENIINTLGKENPLVIGFDGQWGDGKTFFLERWRQSLENDRKKTIYLDAFQCDYIEEPFFAIICEIYEFLGNAVAKDDDVSKKKIEDLSDKTTKVLAYFGKNISDVILKKMTSNTIGLDDIDNMKDIWKSNSNGEIFSKDFKTKFDEHLRFKDNLIDFKDCLAECAKQNIERTGFPIVFIIDELDRCKPTYALELLEKIKHFFSVKGIVFVLSMNKRQLVNSIKNIYGIESDADIYLHKFLTFEASIPKESNHRNGLSYHYETICKYYLEAINCNTHKAEPLVGILQKFNLTFRDCQKIFIYYSFFAIKEGKDLFSFLLAVLKVNNPKTFAKFKNKDLDHHDLIENVICYDPEKDKMNMGQLIEMILDIWDISEEDNPYGVEYNPPKPHSKYRMEEYITMCQILDLYKI